MLNVYVNIYKFSYSIYILPCWVIYYRLVLSSIVDYKSCSLHYCVVVILCDVTDFRNLNTIIVAKLNRKLKN